MRREAGIFKGESNEESTDVVKSKNALLQTHDIKATKFVTKEECNMIMIKMEDALTTKFTIALKELEEKMKHN